MEYRSQRNIKQGMEFDKTNGNTLWQDSIKLLEIKVLTDLECFDFNNPDHHRGREYQKTALTSRIFGIKQDRCHKARLLA